MITKTPEEIEREVTALAGRGLEAAGQFLADQAKRKVSVPAPRKIVYPRKGGSPYYRATTAATPGAPPRLVSGTLRQRIASWTVRPGVVHVGVQKLAYARRHEVGNHPYLIPTLEENLEALGRIVGGEITVGGNV